MHAHNIAADVLNFYLLVAWPSKHFVPSNAAGYTIV